MPLTRRSPTVQARLAPADFARLSDMAKSMDITKGELARDAVLFYLKHLELEKANKQDRELIEAIEKMTNRICGMLARQGTEIGTLYTLTYRGCPEAEFTSALNETKQRQRKRLDEDERALSAQKKKVLKE